MTALGNPVLLCLVVICSTNVARAQEVTEVHPYITEKFFVDVGVFFPDRKIKLSANGTNNDPNPIIDFNEEFRIKNSDETFAADFGWRFAKNWMLLGQFFQSSARSRWTLDEDIEWKDVVFQAGSNVGSGSDFSLTRVFLGRTLNGSDVHEFRLGAGFHWLDMGSFIEGTAIINGGNTQVRREAVHIHGPLPNLGAWYKYSITPRLAFRTRLDWLSANVGRYDGKMINFSLGLNYQVVEHFRVGLNYNDFELDVKVDQTDWRGRVDMTYEGLYAYISAYW
jgi:hypothetical protein